MIKIKADSEKILQELADLPDDFDEEGTSAPTPESIDRVRAFLRDWETLHVIRDLDPYEGFLSLSPVAGEGAIDLRFLRFVVPGLGGDSSRDLVFHFPRDWSAFTFYGDDTRSGEVVVSRSPKASSVIRDG